MRRQLGRAANEDGIIPLWLGLLNGLAVIPPRDALSLPKTR